MKKKIIAVIIDDEVDAVEFITTVINEYCPEIEVAGKAHNIRDGVQVINDIRPDLLFLDIEMPNGTGFDLLKHYPEKEFDVIFITAFNHYAIKAIKYSAFDYILKPVNINEFIDSVSRVVNKHSSGKQYGKVSYEALLENLRTIHPTKLVIPVSDGREYLDTNTIIRIEADRSYSWFFLNDKRKILVSKNLKEFEDLLNDRNFFRPHNSHLINLDFVRKFVRQDGGYIVMCDGSQIPVSRNRKDLFLLQMSRYTTQGLQCE